ncbi:uncharacterized protein F4822DRAFT_398782, partial [Hypoxylon trugodes]|uniref:uncharacterized protein n=1 Tax=Hypoxylon trugodes TaxID=326681 RepID=UPI00219F6CDA
MFFSFFLFSPAPSCIPLSFCTCGLHEGIHSSPLSQIHKFHSPTFLFQFPLFFPLLNLVCFSTVTDRPYILFQEQCSLYTFILGTAAPSHSFSSPTEENKNLEPDPTNHFRKPDKKKRNIEL